MWYKQKSTQNKIENERNQVRNKMEIMLLLFLFIFLFYSTSCLFSLVLSNDSFHVTASRCQYDSGT